MKSLIDLIQSSLNISDLNKALNDNNTIKLYTPTGVLPFVMDNLAEKYTVFFVAKDELLAEGIFENMHYTKSINALFFPEVDVIPFTNVYPSRDKLADRINTMYQLYSGNNKTVVISTAEAFFRKLPPIDFFKKTILNFKIEQIIDVDKITHRLASMDYVREYKVTEQGTFSVRGDIIDIFPPNNHNAIRINLFDNEIESIKEFNPISQKSLHFIDHSSIVPASEFEMMREIEIETNDDEILSAAQNHSIFTGFYSSFNSIIDYDSSGRPTLLILDNGVIDEYQNVVQKYDLYSPENKDGSALLFKPEQLVSDKTVNITKLRETDAIQLNAKHAPKFEGGFSAFIEWAETTIAENSITNNTDNNCPQIFVFVEHKNIINRLASILSKINPHTINTQTPLPEGQFFLIETALEQGFTLHTDNGRQLYFFSESDISGKRRLFHKRIRQIESLFEDVQDIQQGEYVVHLNYGIGKFRGIERINALGKEKDYIMLEYAEKEKLYVPLEQANLIGKYVGTVGSKPRLDSLGGKSWAKKRAGVKQSVELFAKKLVAIYAKRSTLDGHAFVGDTVWQKDFEDQFEYLETPDQVTVIEEIKKDMENRHPMDRLLCGDVGFGKTEVAMRAAFKSVMDGRQVAIIAPTTVLTEQHYYTFTERFRGFPLKIASVSRFTSTKDFNHILKELKNGKIDIIIGTHKLFSNKIEFHQLGLVVIDEEHRFGVEQKEKMKEKYPLVDFLALSATPIPRTLNMALGAVRDISLLRTPPDMRIPIQTFMSDFSMDVVSYAVKQELDRGGQVFFVHNNIKRLPEFAFAIEQTVAKAKVTIGHGQMNEKILDEAFMGFVHGHYNVFVCTTIIESGLDIPNANTIIISDANRYGLAQLYQLKGRVGRAKREGFAYFLYPRDKVLTENAQKRLFVINEYTDLGAGFNIAMKDLEIRGAGNILGREQHGNIIAVGYDMYTRLLREEVQKIKGEAIERIETIIDLNYSAFIPDEYISEPSVKMEIYKKIVSVKDEHEIKMLIEELVDRFGKIPEHVSTLFEISRLKIKACDMGIKSLMEKGDSIEIEFTDKSKVDPIKVLNIKDSVKHDITIRPYYKNKIFYKRFDSNVMVKVKRLTAFLEDVREA